MRLQAQIALALGSTVVSLGLAMIPLAQQARRSEQAIGRESGPHLAHALGASRVALAALECRRFEKDLLLNMGTPDLLRRYARSWESAVEELTHSVRDLLALTGSRQESTVAAPMELTIQGYQQAVRDVLESIQAGSISDPFQANRALTPFKPQIRGLIEAAHEMQERELRDADRVERLLKEQLATGRRQTLLLLGLIVLAASILVFWLPGRVTRPLLELKQRMDAFRDGRLRGRVELRGADEIRELSAAFHVMAEQQRESHRKLQQALLEAQKADRAKGRFLAGMSHELRTPLNGVLGMADVLQQTDLTADQARCVETITGSGSRLLAVISDILDFSMLDAGKLELERSDFELGPLVEDVLESYSEALGRRGLEGRILVADKVPRFLVGDRDRLKQILDQLLGNAVKFTDQGAILVRVEVDRAAPSHIRLRFEVEDSGVGIREETQAILFEPFIQGESFATRKHGGSGLGLSICRQLVDLMGGAIGVRSHPGQGSTFWFTAEFEPRAPEMRDPLPGMPKTPAHILVVDDNPVNRRVAEYMLKALGQQTTVVEDGEAALSLLSKGSFDLVLMDCQMPVMDGFEATQRIRELPEPRSRIPVVAMTANALKGDRERCLSAGMDDFLSKPFRRPDLEAILTRHLSARAGAEVPI